MQNSFDIQRIFREYPELLYAIMAIFFYMLSAIIGILDIGDTRELYGIRFHLVSTTLWATFGLLSLYFLYTAFFDMWIYTIHLIIAYFLAGAGMLTIYIFQNDIYPLIIGIGLLVVSLVFIIFFIIKIGDIRTYRIFKSRDIEAAKERYSLGSWYLVPFVFFGLILASFIFIGHGYENENTPYGYIILEFCLIVTLVYTLWIPENILFYGVKEEDMLPDEDDTKDRADDSSAPTPLTGTGERKRKGTVSPTKGEAERGETHDTAEKKEPSMIKKQLRKRGEAKADCPGSKKPPAEKKKACPSCGNTFKMYFCPESEEYLVECSSCGKQTYHGRKVCVHCRQRLSEKITCDNCGKSFQIRKFKDAT